MGHHEVHVCSDWQRLCTGSGQSPLPGIHLRERAYLWPLAHTSGLLLHSPKGGGRRLRLRVAQLQSTAAGSAVLLRPVC